MRYHARDLRKGRYSKPGLVYLITTVTSKRVPAFRDFYAARVLINALKESDHKEWTSTLGFVVMPDHLHWVMCLGKETNLGQTVRGVKGASALRINRLGCGAHFQWQKGFHDHVLRRDESLPRILRYVLRNPVRAGLVESVRNYPHWDCVYVQG